MSTATTSPPTTASSHVPSGASATPTVDVPRARTRWSRGHVLMVVAALLAVLGNLALLRGGEPTRMVVLAARDLAPGVVVTAEDLVTTVVPDATALDGLASSVDELVGLVVTDTLRADDVVRSSDLVAPVAADAELRQLSLRVPPERAVGGRLVPDDRVDVIEVTADGPRYLVTDVRVVAVGEPSAGLGQLTQHHVVVEVDADGALCLAAALSAGEVDLVRTTGQSVASAAGCS